MKKNKTHDIIVIGAGSGGLNIAGFMNKAGFRVLLIDKSDKNIGGDCLNFGCVPSKALIHISRLIYSAKESKKFGIKLSGNVDIKKVTGYINQKKEHIRVHENADYFRKQGMEVVLGEAEFTDKNSVKVNGEEYTAKKIIIATGSRPRKLDTPGVEKVKNIYTNETIFDLKKLPKKLVVIGGGPIGIELGQALSRLGSKVTIINNRHLFLVKEDREISEVLKKQLESEGINIHLNCEPIKFLKENKILVKDQKEGEKTFDFDAILVAIGRELNIPKRLETAGIETTPDNKKIKVNSYLQTTNKNVYLCGDIAGSYQFTHAAELHAGVILSNFFSPFKKKVSYDNFSWVTYTDPEIATFGLSEQSLKKRNISYKKIIQDYSEVDRGITDSAKGKLILFISKNKILGGSLISPNAGEIFQELSLANSTKLNIKQIFSKIYPYPTASRINKQTITQLFAGKLTPKTKKILGFLYH